MLSMLCANCGRPVTRAHTDVPTAPVPEVLGSNLMLSKSQADMVTDTISHTQSRISDIDDDLARLMVSVNELQRKRVALVEYVQTHTMLLAPIRRLPPEILSEIFLHCMQTKRPDPPYHFQAVTLDRAPLLLSQICNKWRSITLSTQRFWSSLALTIRPKYLKGDVLLAKTWLGRSGTCPLSISLRSSGNYQNSMRSLMQIFLLHCERWYDIYLSLPPSVICSLSAAKNRLPRLRSLCVSDLWNDTIDIFECAPQLRYFYLAPHIALSKVKIPWHQLQYYDTGLRTSDGCLEVLRLTPNIQGCTVSVFSPMTPSAIQSPVQLPRLHSITIRGNPVDLLDKLIVPELHEVSVQITTDEWAATPQLTSLFSRCSIQMVSFTVNSVATKHLHEDDMIQLLQALPTLVDLELGGYSSKCMTKSFLVRLAHRRGSERLVPLLHTIKVDYTPSHPSHFDLSSFVVAIQARTILDAFKKVEIRVTSEEDAELFFDTPTLSRLRQLRDSGLDISILRGGRDLLQAGGILDEMWKGR